MNACARGIALELPGEVHMGQAGSPAAALLALPYPSSQAASVAGSQYNQEREPILVMVMHCLIHV